MGYMQMVRKMRSYQETLQNIAKNELAISHVETVLDRTDNEWELSGASLIIRGEVRQEVFKVKKISFVTEHLHDEDALVTVLAPGGVVVFLSKNKMVLFVGTATQMLKQEESVISQLDELLKIGKDEIVKAEKESDLVLDILEARRALFDILGPQMPSVSPTPLNDRARWLGSLVDCRGYQWKIIGGWLWLEVEGVQSFIRNQSFEYLTYTIFLVSSRSDEPVYLVLDTDKRTHSTTEQKQHD